MPHRSKYTIEDMKTLAKERGGKCLSENYVNSHTKLKWKCRGGHIWNATPNNIKNGKWCPICAIRHRAESRKLSIEEMQLIAKKRGGKCLSKIYVNNHTKLEWQCSKNHTWMAKPSNIKLGKWCPVCAGNQKLNIEEMRSIAKERDGECLSKKYIRTDTKLRWQCNKNHIWYATPDNIKHGSWCPECAGNKRLNIEDMQKIAIERGGKCLSKKYRGAHTRLKWQCKEVHIWEASPTSIKRGSWCPECSTGLGERICRESFEQLFKKKFPKSRPKWLVNKENNQMELDGYCEDIGLAFEHQGEQHYNHVEYYHSEKQFIKRLRDDKEKIYLCKKNDVILIQVPEIPEKLAITKIKDFIEKECNNSPISFNNIEINLLKAYTPDSKCQLEIIKMIAKRRDGRCLSKVYLGSNIKLHFECKMGHKWYAKPSNIKNGKWCPVCGTKAAAEKQKSTIEEMHKYAKKQGGICLSKKYINDRTKLRWQCSLKHIWNATPSNIKRGRWCPICGSKRGGEKQKLSIEEMREIAKAQGGKCLSESYENNHTKLKWRCEKGHIWYATPNKIKIGRWCPKCAIHIRAEKLRSNIGEMQKIAKIKGGKCLSPEYINTDTKLTWECKNGHRWDARPSKIKSGQWCPECAKINRGNKHVKFKN